jgi:hypothetical protein
VEEPVKPTAKSTVRVVFVVTLLWITLLQYTLFAFGEEPYPALVLPSFPAVCAGCLLETGVPAAKEPALLVRFTGGRTQQIPLGTILPPGPSVRLMAFTAAFKDGTINSNPEALTWLQSQIAERFPNESIAGLDIVWRKATYLKANASATQYMPMYTVHINFENVK